MAGLNDQEAALRTQGIIERTVLRLIDQQRPSDRYGTVVSITQSTRTVAVQLAGETSPVNVRFGAIQPTQIGQVVRIGGNAGDRWVVDVIGQAALTGLSLGDLVVPDGVTFTQFGANGLVDWEQGSTLSANNTIGDGFNRADETLDTSPNWNAGADIEVVTNELKRVAVGANYAAHVAPVDDSQNMYAQVRVTAVTSEVTGSRSVNLEISRDDDVGDGTAARVFARYDQDAARYELYSFNGTTATLEGSYAASAPVVPYTLKLDRKGDTYTVYENNNPVVATTITGRNGSYVGLHFQDADEMTVDDFAAGSYVNNFTAGSSYEVHVADDAGFTTNVRSSQTGNSQHIAKNLNPGFTYYARVRAVSGTTASSWSATASYLAASLPLTSVTDGSVPDDSPDVTCTGGIGWVLAEWPTQLNSDPVTYEVYVSDESGFTPGPATKIGETTGTFYTVRRYADDSPLSYTHNVFVRVIAKDADGSALVAGAQGFAKPLQVELGDVGNTVVFSSGDGTTPQDAPANFSVASGIGFLYCKWDHVANTDAVTYELHLSTTAIFTPTSATLVGDTPSNFSFIKKLPSNLGGGPLNYGTTYYVILWAKDEDGYAPIYSESVSANVVKATQLDFDALSVGTAQIIDASIVTAKIADLAVDTAKINDLSVTTGKINSLAVGSAQIALLAVGAAQIADLAVSSAKIGNLAVTNGKIASLAVDTAQIANAAIENAQMADLSVSEGKIQNLAVTNAKIANASIDNAKIASLSADKLNAGSINASIITVTNINASNISTGSLSATRISGGTLDAGTITVNNLNATNITTGSLSMSRISNGAITSTQLGTNSVTNTQIGTSAVQGYNIGSNAVQNSQLDTNAVQGYNITSLAVTNAKIGSSAITNVKIGNAAVTGAKIASATITDANIGSLNAGKITAGTMSADRINGGTITGQTITGGTITGSVLKTSTSGARVEIGGTYPNDVVFYGTSGGAVRLYGAASTIVATNTISLAAGSLLCPGYVRGGYGSAAAPAFAFSGNTNTGMYRITTNAVGLSAGGAVKMEIRPSEGAWRWTGSRYLALQTDGNFVVYNGGTVVWSSGTSDRRLKKNINDLTFVQAHRLLKKLRPVHYEWKDITGYAADGLDRYEAGEKHIGFIGQEVDRVFKQAVDLVRTPRSGDMPAIPDMHMVRKQEMVPALVAAYLGLAKEVQDLKSEMQELIQSVEFDT